MSSVSLDHIIQLATETATEIKEFFHRIKLEKLQQLHETESIGSRDEQIEQEQAQQELSFHPLTANDEDEDEILIDSGTDLFNSEPLLDSIMDEFEEEEDPSEFQETSDLL